MFFMWLIELLESINSMTGFYPRLIDGNEQAALPARPAAEHFSGLGQAGQSHAARRSVAGARDRRAQESAGRCEPKGTRRATGVEDPPHVKAEAGRRRGAVMLPV
jgi:hypothetical protein